MNPNLDRQGRRPEWPHPGESPLARARRIAHLYRQHVNSHDPGLCEHLDNLILSFGEKWIVPRLLIHDNDDDLLPPADAADMLCLTTAAVRVLRHRGRLEGHRVSGVWHYRVGDLRALLGTRTRTVSR